MTTSSGVAIPPRTDFWDATSPRSALREVGAESAGSCDREVTLAVGQGVTRWSRAREDAFVGVRPRKQSGARFVPSDATAEHMRSALLAFVVSGGAMIVVARAVA